MKSALHKILSGAIAICSIGMITACSIYDRYSVDDGLYTDPKLATLVLQVGLATPSRAAADIEKMHSLRVVMLDANGKVEYNDFVDNSHIAELGSGIENTLDYSQYRLIRTNPGKKKIFFIANENSVDEVKGFGNGSTLTNVLDSKQVGDSGFEDMVNSIYFTPDFEKDIVLSSVYDFEISQAEAGSKVRKTFWVVRAATKFDIVVENYRANDVQIDKIDISKIADDMFLMAHVYGDDLHKPIDSDMDGNIDGETYYWVEWLRWISEWSQLTDGNYNSNVAFNEKYGWIKYYDIPDDHIGSNNENAVTLVSTARTVSKYGETDPGRETFGPFYYSESRSGFNAGVIQQYNIIIDLTDQRDGRTHQFEKQLPNLEALFRNTHVKITVKMNGQEDKTDIELLLGICPWDEGTIDIPSFD